MINLLTIVKLLAQRGKVFDHTLEPAQFIPVQHDDEFIAAAAAENSRVRKEHAHDGRQMTQGLIANLMAEKVVDVLEIIDIELDKHDVVRVLAGQQVLCGLFEAMAVEQARQIVLRKTARRFSISAFVPPSSIFSTIMRKFVDWNSDGCR